MMVHIGETFTGNVRAALSRIPVSIWGTVLCSYTVNSMISENLLLCTDEPHLNSQADIQLTKSFYD